MTKSYGIHTTWKKTGVSPCIIERMIQRGDIVPVKVKRSAGNTRYKISEKDFDKIKELKPRYHRNYTDEFNVI